MKALCLLPILLLSLISCSSEVDAAVGTKHGTYMCKVDRIAGVSEEHSKLFSVQNGKVEPHDEHIYIIGYDEDGLSFLNYGNGAKGKYVYGDEQDGFKVFFDGWQYQFRLSNSSNDFEFIVTKANYYAEYLGTCEAYIPKEQG